MSNIDVMSLEMSMGKDERKFRMRVLLDKGECFTVTACSKSIGVSRETVLKYLKEMNVAVFDDKKGELTKVYNDDTKIYTPFEITD